VITHRCKNLLSAGGELNIRVC